MSRGISLLIGYGVGVLGTAVALLLVFMLKAVLQPEFPGQIASPLFLLVVVVSAWYGGKWPVLVTAILAYLTLDYVFLHSVYSLSLGWEDIPLASIYLLAALVVSTLEERQRRAEWTLRRLKERMLIARTIQARLLPQAPPNVAGFDIAGASHPAEATGGDYFDFISMLGGKTGIVVADVCGHGFTSALLMAETRAYLRALALTHNDLGALLTLTSALLTEDTDDDLFVTLFIACIHPSDRSLVYAGAGHDAYLLHAKGHLERLPSTGLPLGVANDVLVPGGSCVVVEDGDIVLLVTDGIVEAQSQRGEQFGMDRTIEVINANRARSAREIIDQLLEAVRDFSDRMPQGDDMTVVIVKANGQRPSCNGELTTPAGACVTASAPHPVPSTSSCSGS